ncbi:hypothetical protein MBLNU13_g10996t1 [Cladosporium sp. NU13]
MGVQGRGKRKSKMEEMREQMRGMQMDIDELKHATQHDTEDRCLEADTGAAASCSSRQKVAAHRRDRRRRAPSVSDDDEETPEWVIKRERLAQSAEAGSATVPEPPAALKRKRPSETSQLSDLSDSDLVGSRQDRGQRKGATHATQPTRSKRVRLEVDSDSDESSSDRDAAETSSAPRKKHTAAFAHKGSIGSKFTNSKPNLAGPPRVFKPASTKSLPRPQWTIALSELAKEFRQPTSSLKVNAICEANVNNNQKASTKTGPSQDEHPTPSKPSYAEIESFEFKLVVSYSKDGTEYHQSTDLEGNMKTFWSRLEKQRKEWEDAAGAEWAWELQKAKGRVHGRRSCVSSKLAKRPTRWRKGDTGDYACRHCAMNTLLCFTWVEDEDPEHDSDGEEAVIPKPRGEFWCLPVHPDDRRCGEVKKDREIHTWLNEEDNSESDSSGDAIGESSDEDEFKVGSDYGQLSESESSSEEEDNAKESDKDDEL